MQVIDIINTSILLAKRWTVSHIRITDESFGSVIQEFLP